MKMKTLDRINRAKDAWDAAIFVLEVADFVTNGRVMRALHNAGRPKSFSAKRPAEYTIKVPSQRG